MVNKCILFFAMVVFSSFSATYAFSSDGHDLLFTENFTELHRDGTTAILGKKGVLKKTHKGHSEFVHVRVGVWKSWWYNGKIQSQEHFCDGLAFKEKECKLGQKHGKTTSWFLNGKLRSVRSYRAGKEIGTSVWYFSNQQLRKKTHYENGVKSGVSQVWWPNGSNASLGSYANGKQEGAWKTWYADGKLKSIVHFSNGLQEGPFTEWWSICRHTGCFHQKMRDGEYKAGKKTGTWTYWDLKNRLLSESQWNEQFAK